MTKSVLRHNSILGPFQGRDVPFTGRHAHESLHPVSIPYSAMPCNMLKMKLRMPSRYFSDSVLTICRRSSVYTIQLQASDMGYGAALSPGSVCAAGWNHHLQLGIREMCEPVSFRSGNRTAIWRKRSHFAKFSAYAIQGNKDHSSQFGTSFHVYNKAQLYVVACLQLHVLLQMFQCFCLVLPRGYFNWGRKKNIPARVKRSLMTVFSVFWNCFLSHGI